MVAKDKSVITLRLRRDISEKVTKKAIELGISKNAYITMVLSKELSDKNEK